MGRPRVNASKDDQSPRETIIHMKGSGDYVEWLDQVHKQSHIPKAQIFRIAVAEWAAKNGYQPPPEI